jgi:hypothetical protein
MKRSALALFLLLALSGGAPAEDRKLDAAALGKALAPFLEDGTFFVAHVDLTRVDLDKLKARVAAVTGAPAEGFEPMVSEDDRKRLKGLREAGARDLFVTLAIADRFSNGVAIIVPLEEGSDASAISKALERPGTKTLEMGEAVLTGEPSTVDRLRHKKGVARPELVPALTAAGDGVAQVVFLLPADLRKGLEEIMPRLPPELGGGSITAFTRGFMWGAIGIQADPEARLQVVVASSNEVSARELHAALDRAVKAAAESKDVRAVLARAGEVLPRFLPKPDGDLLRLTLDEKALAELTQPLFVKARGAASRVQSMNNLKQILLAMHNYHDTYGRFPAAASFSAAGKPLLSWRVHLLPYLEQGELYKQFKLDEPWDSEHNKKLLTKMPRVFDSTGNRKLAAAGETTYLGPRGKETMFPPQKQGLRISEVFDGSSTTIFLVDADDSHAVPWTKPDDLEVDLSDPAKGLSLRFESGYLVGFGDGSVRLLTKKIDKATLKALFTRAGGEAVTIP